MITFNYETEFKLIMKTKIASWISDTIVNEAFKEGDINFIFCGDDYLLDINVKYLKHEVNFDDELHRVIIHGILHFCGYKDKTKEDKRLMRKKEDYYLSLRTF